MNFPTTLETTAWMPYVLAALRALGPRGEEVRFRDVITHIESLTDFPGWDTWGTKMKRGKPYFAGHRAVTLAGGRLKKDGMATNPRRGYYALSSELASTEATPEATPAPVVETMAAVTLTETVTEEATVEAPAAIKVVTKGDGACYLPPTGAVTHESYSTEADLRRVAIDNTRCFSLWSPRSSQCEGCPLAGLCQASSIATLAAVAAELDDGFAAEVAKAEAELAAERARLVAALEASMAPAPEVEVTPLAVDYSTVVVPFACVCSAEGCKGTIEANATAAHVEGRGVFHTECAIVL
jgi:hypothetical protein